MAPETASDVEEGGGPPRVCMIVNKPAGKLAPSETFLRAHASHLHKDLLVLVGDPGRRRIGVDGGPYLASRHVVLRGFRWALGRCFPRWRETLDGRAVQRFLERQGVDVVLAEYGPTAISVRDPCRRAGIPLVAHFHGWDAYVLPARPEVLAGYRRVFEDATAIVAVSRHMVKQLVSLGAPEEKVHWNPCGAVVPEIAARPGAAPPLFVAVGRFTPKKAPDVTIRAFATVAREISDARLEMIGHGPLFESSKRLARDLGVHRRITFRGAATHERVYESLAAARCFVQHSVEAPNGDREGTPVAVLEAMAIGLPVVSTRHTGITDVVEEGSTGTLVDEFDVEGMARAMIAYGTDPARAEAHGRAAREAVQQHWSMDLSIQRLRAIIREAARRPTAG